MLLEVLHTHNETRTGTTTTTGASIIITLRYKTNSFRSITLATNTFIGREVRVYYSRVCMCVFMLKLRYYYLQILTQNKRTIIILSAHTSNHIYDTPDFFIVNSCLFLYINISFSFFLNSLIDQILPLLTTDAAIQS